MTTDRFKNAETLSDEAEGPHVHMIPDFDTMGILTSRTLARGWLIERARNKRLREELDTYKDFASHWESGLEGVHLLGVLLALRERFDV